MPLFSQVKEKLDFYFVPFLPVERVFDSTDPYQPLKLPPFAKCTALRFNWTNWPMKLTPFYVAIFQLGGSACPTLPWSSLLVPHYPWSPWCSTLNLCKFCCFDFQLLPVTLANINTMTREAPESSSFATLSPTSTQWQERHQKVAPSQHSCQTTSTKYLPKHSTP